MVGVLSKGYCPNLSSTRIIPNFLLDIEIIEIISLKAATSMLHVENVPIKSQSLYLGDDTKHP